MGWGGGWGEGAASEQRGRGVGEGASHTRQKVARQRVGSARGGEPGFHTRDVGRGGEAPPGGGAATRILLSGLPPVAAPL